ncbi:MAG: GNAT family N-acetyltransferase [Planctomycetes bacterium]|nr:GNAT family N-acetyltransferase [Planctomycetota bacterium]
MKIYRKTPGITVQLRRATDEDLLEMEIKYPEDRLLPTMSAMESYVLIVGEDRYRRPVGFVEYYSRDGELVVTGLWVAPDHRGNGYGTMMLELAEATERPDMIRVIVTPQSESFYVQRGFAPDNGMHVMTKVCGYD